MATLYLNGIKAYMSNQYGISRKVKKSDFEQLITDQEEFDVILLTTTATKYAPKITRKGYVLTSNKVYNTFPGELKLQYKKLHFDLSGIQAIKD